MPASRPDHSTGPAGQAEAATVAQLARRALVADRHLAGLERHLAELGLLAERGAVATARRLLAGCAADPRRRRGRLS